jgi:hypothetical protein
MEPQKVFYIHNTTRDPATRSQRRGLCGPESSTKNLFIGGHLRVVRGRPSPVTESFVRANRIDLADKEAKGLVVVYTHNSKRVNLETMEPRLNAPPPPVHCEDVVVVESADDTSSLIPNDEISCADDAPLKILAEEAQTGGEPEEVPMPSEEPATNPEVSLQEERSNPFGKKRRR